MSRTRRTKAPWKQSKKRGTAYENRYRDLLRARGLRTLRTAGSMSDGTGIDVIAWKGALEVWASCKDDGRKCRSAENLLETLRGMVPEAAIPVVVHSLPETEFCEHPKADGGKA